MHGQRLLLCAGLLLSGCEMRGALHHPGGTQVVSWNGRAAVLDETASEERELALSFGAPGRVVLERFDGALAIRADPAGAPRLRAHLEVRAESTLEARKVLRALDVEAEQRPDGLALRVRRHPVDLPYLTSSRYELLLPPGTAVEARTAEGGIVLEGPLGPCELAADRGDVSAARVRGELRARSGGGRVALA